MRVEGIGKEYRLEKSGLVLDLRGGEEEGDLWEWVQMRMVIRWDRSKRRYSMGGECKLSSL